MSTVARIQWFAMVLYLFAVHFEQWDPFSTGIDFIVYKVTVVFYFIAALFDRRRFFALKEVIYFLYPILAYFALTTVTSYMHRSPGNDEYIPVAQLLHVLSFVMLTNHFRNDTKALRAGLTAFALGGIAVTVLFYAGVSLSYYHDRVALFGANQNESGQRVAVTMIILISLVFGKNFRSVMARYGALLILPFLAVFLIRTGSRMALLGLLVGMLAFFVLGGSHRNSTYVIKLVVGAFFCYAMWIFASTSEVMSHRLMGLLNEGDMSGRDYIWTKLSDLVWANPWFGVGRSGFAVESKRIFGEYTAAHNTFLQVLCYGGFVGLSLFLIFMGRIVVAGIRSYKHSGAIVSLSLLAQVVPMMMVGDSLSSETCWYILAYVASQTPKRERPSGTGGMSQKDKDATSKRGYVNGPLRVGSGKGRYANQLNRT